MPPRHSIKVRRGSWISLFAMLMIFIGPLISQAMPMDQAMPMNMSMSMDMHSGEPGCHGETQPSAQPGKTQSEHHGLWEKCGYCSLLFNCPALPGGLSFSIAATPPNTPFVSPSPRLGHARQTVFPGALTRAPPAIR
ncbi:DUF2946 domain-containing protein [Pseudomonas sp. TH05]|uniref:DUF2946 family protein n=1 Tax=unclassified Pseudomonas TaxID=196821 RepID=UPI0019131F62|nr:DUF2946 domain-containing protein [Pseudomonas sp. TH07]MBK5556294.1 DUF2946 domain-containing protein [Pseudomonas sp. TH05]